MVTWWRNDDRVVYDERVELLEDGSLYISSVRLSDDGVYQCMAINDNGNVTSDYGMVNVSGKSATHTLQEMVKTTL